MWTALTDARADSILFAANKTLAVSERTDYFSEGKRSRISRRTPETRQLERRLAGMTLSALGCLRRKEWLRSESNLASASTQPSGVCRRAPPSRPGGRRNRSLASAAPTAIGPELAPLSPAPGTRSLRRGYGYGIGRESLSWVKYAPQAHQHLGRLLDSRLVSNAR